MTTEEAAAKLGKALERLPGIERRIVERQPKEKVKQGQERLKLLGGDIAASIELLNVEEPETPAPPVIPGPYPDLPDPPSSENMIKDKKFTGGDGGYGNPFFDLSKAKRLVVTKCYIGDSARSICHGKCGEGVIFYDDKVNNLYAEGVHGGIGFFPGTNWQTSRDDYGLKIIGVDFTNNKLAAEIELKCEGTQVIGCTGEFSARIRHGTKSWFINNPGAKVIAVRCGPHVIAYSPKCKVNLHAGNLFGKEGEWEPNSGSPDHHNPGEGNNMQCSYDCDVVGVGEVVIGFHYGDNDKKYPATACNIDPSQKNVKIIFERETTYNKVNVPTVGLSRAFAKMKSRFLMEEEQAEAEVRNKIQETNHWYTEYLAGVYRQVSMA